MSVFGFSLLDAAGLLLFALSWAAYHLTVERHTVGGRSLNALMNRRRTLWIEQAARRDVRIIDTQILASLQNGTAFFASTSIFAIGGALTLLQSADKVIPIFADLPLAGTPTRLVWELKVIGLVLILAYAFFKFSWAYRLFNYTAILLGALPPPQAAASPEGRRATRETARMSIAAGLNFSRGQRAFFFAIAYLGWFAGPAAWFLATLSVLVVMASRQFWSPAYRAVSDTGHGDSAEDDAGYD